MNGFDKRLRTLEQVSQKLPICRWLTYGEKPEAELNDGRPVIYFSWLPPQEGPVDEHQV
jgi:hypothetical protein